MSNSTGEPLQVTDVSKVLSIYSHVYIHGEERGVNYAKLVNDVGEITDSKGKETESITLGVAELEDGPVFELEIIFSKKDILFDVLNEIVHSVEDIPEIKALDEVHVTSHLIDTKRRVRRKHGYVG